MSNKTKSTKSTLDQIGELAQTAGLLMMTAAVTLGMVEIPEHRNSKIVVPNQTAYSYADSGADLNSELTMRKEKEEHGPHFISYSTIQRTASRTGKA